MASPVAAKIAERHQAAAIVGQQLDRMPVGRRDDRLAEPETVGKRARSHLGGVEIGRHVDVAHRDVFKQRGPIDELIVEDDMLANAERGCPGYKAFAIGLALVPHQIGMAASTRTT